MFATDPSEDAAEPPDIRFPTWLEFVDANLFWPFIAQLLLTLALNALSVLYTHAYNHRSDFYRFVHAYIGRSENMRVKSPAFIVSCYILQLVFSMGSVCMFAVRTYTHQVSKGGHIVEVVFCSFFALHYLVTRMQAGFRPSSAWAPCALIDTVTVVPVLAPAFIGIEPVPAHVRWLSLSYLRSYRALTAYQRLERTVGLGEVSEFYRRLWLAFLRTAAMVICMGCTILILEVLGEIPGCEDSFISTDMGDLSFVQMVYWMFTTISTVGYGDFSPKTAPSRLFIIAFIVGGVAFFGVELECLVELRTLLHKGKGRYIPPDRETMHIVALGPGVSRFSPTMESFLSEMLDTEHGMHAPDVVLLSEVPFEEELVRFVRTELPLKVRRRVYFLVGSAMMPCDLARARLRRCAMAFVLPCTEAPDSLAEDGQNMLRAMELKRYRPKLQLRLMLLQPESKLRAMNIGIEQDCCFSAFEQKINLIAQSTRVRGFLPLVAGLLQVMTPFHYQEALQQVQAKDREWMLEYLSSLRNTTYGFVVGAALVGLQFKEAVAKVYEESEGCALIIAVQHQGCLALNFEGRLKAGQVVIAIACNRQVCCRFAVTSVDWRIEFLQQREDALHGTQTVGSIRSRTQRLRSLKQADSLGADGPWSARVTRMASTASTTRSRSSAVQRIPRAVSENSDFGDDENEEPMNEFIRTREAKEAQEFRGDPSLVTLVVAKGAAWQQVVAFLRTLRQPFLPNHQPVIVLSSRAPPLSVVETFEAAKTVFLVGPVLRVHNLLQAGVQRAQTVVVLCGEQRRESPTASAAMLTDHDSVLLANTVEQLLAGSEQGRCPIYEFATTKAVRLVEHVSSGTCHVRPSLQSLKSTLPQQASGASVREDLSICYILRRRCQRMLTPLRRALLIAKNICLDLFSNTDLADLEDGDRENGEEAEGEIPGGLGGKLLFQPRFAAGQAFTLDFFGSALGHIYHFPPSIELMEALTMPARRGQATYPWQVRCPPEWVGRTFGELLHAWLLGKDPELPEGETAVTLALYRQRRSLLAAGQTLPADQALPLTGGYNVTLPARSAKLVAADLVTVLAGLHFGQTMAKRGLLCGAEAGLDSALPSRAVPGMPNSSSLPSMASISEAVSIEASERSAFSGTNGEDMPSEAGTRRSI